MSVPLNCSLLSSHSYSAAFSLCGQQTLNCLSSRAQAASKARIAISRGSKGKEARDKQKATISARKKWNEKSINNNNSNNNNFMAAWQQEFSVTF